MIDLFKSNIQVKVQKASQWTEERTATKKLNSGLHYHEAHNYINAIQSFQEARQIYAKYRNEAALADTNRYLGAAYLGCDQYENASQALTLAYDYYRARWDRRVDSAICAFALGDAVSKLGKYEDAHAHYAEAKRLFLKVNLKANAAKCDQSIGLLCSLTKQHDVALSCLQSAASVFELCEVYDEAAKTYSLMADVCKAQGMNMKMAHYHNKAKFFDERSAR